MLVEVLLPVEAASALGAEVAVDASVDAHVSREVAATVEDLATVRADEEKLTVDQLRLFLQLQVVALLHGANHVWAVRQVTRTSGTALSTASDTRLVVTLLGGHVIRSGRGREQLFFWCRQGGSLYWRLEW